MNVTGTTVKSRLVVSPLNKDQLEECLMIGISKYIIDDNDGASLGMMRDAVEDQAKELILNRCC